jgi:hypothetical protein
VDARTFSRARAANRSRAGAGAEIRLAPAVPPSGFLHRRARWLWELTHQPRGTAGSLWVTEEALVVNAPREFRGRIKIPWGTVRKAVVDDGARWGYVSEVCRFPVHANRPEDSGYGALIGPLWSEASSLMPPDCAIAELDPVPAQPPNLALIFEPGVPAPSARGEDGHGSPDPASLVGLLVRTDNPDAARTAIASRLEVGDVDRADLEYLIQCGQEGSESGRGQSPESLRRSGASGAGVA